jgi:hypothetical protein
LVFYRIQWRKFVIWNHKWLSTRIFLGKHFDPSFKTAAT